MKAGSFTSIAGTAASVLALALPLAAQAEPVALAPAITDYGVVQYGSNARYTAVDGNALFSNVLWNESTQSYANYGAGGSMPGGYAPITSYCPGGNCWGTGIWGLADWATVQGGGVAPIAQWSGVLDTIDQGNATYNSAWAPTWGASSPLPAGIPETNWAAQYTGYLRITDAGDYNFGVLYDDGFFLRICGADACVEISSDFIISAREVLGFDTDLALGEGLYRYELGSYNRLEAGVTRLLWWHDDGWQLVPNEHLVAEIPLPATLGLIGLGVLGALGPAWRARRRPAPATAA